MRHLLSTAAVLLMTFAAAPTASADEKNGLSVNVTKRTINRLERKDASSANRTQGYKMTVRNISLKAMPEGEVEWTILVRKAKGDGAEKYTGVETLKPLRSSESVELMVGAVPIGGVKNDKENTKDDMDYEVTVFHGDKETIRLTSMANFAGLARNAKSMDPEGDKGEKGDGPRRRKKRNRDGAETPEPAPGTIPPVTPGTARPEGPMVTGNPAAPLLPATPAGLGSAAPTSPVTTATTDRATPPAPSETQPFDFFNLKKKAPVAK